MVQQNLLDKYGFRQEQIILVVILVGYFIFLTYSTQPVPNVVNETIMYGMDAYAPPTYVTGTQAGIGILLVLVLVVSFRIKDLQKGRVSERKFKEFLSREIKIKQDEDLPDGKRELPEGEATIDPNIFTLWEYRKEQRIPIQYIAQVRITGKDSPENYFLFIGDPVNMMIDDIIQVDEPLEYADKCPDCEGRFPNRELVLVDDLKKFKEMKKAFSSD